MKIRPHVFGLCLLFVAVQIIYAQGDNCPQIVQQGLMTVRNACADLGRNQACYGNNHLEAKLNDTSLPFSQPADRVPLDTVQTIRTFPLDEQLGEWGVALLHIQANLPDTLPGQAVKFILYGEVELSNAGGGDTAFKPMQAFYFTSGGQEPACEEAPASALVIQSPGGHKVNLTVNGLDLNIGSSVSLKATPGERMTITTLEGLVEAEYNGGTRPIPEGFEASVPLGGEEGLTVDGPLEAVYLFDDEDWVTLAEATDGLLETELALPDTDLWASAEDYCADPANAETCAGADFLDSPVISTPEGETCAGDENALPCEVIEPSCGDLVCDANEATGEPMESASEGGTLSEEGGGDEGSGE
jgi:hypothetical protein